VCLLAILGLTPQALCCRPLRGLIRGLFPCDPGARAPGFMLPPASRADSCLLAILGLAPQALCCRPLRGLIRVCLRSWGLRPRLYAVARFAGSRVKPSPGNRCGMV